MQLDVAASQVAGGNRDGTLAGARIRQFQAESIHADSGLAVVLRPGAELDAGIVGRRQIGVCRSADVADGGTRSRFEVTVDADTADMQAGEESRRVMVYKIDVAEVAAIFASADKAKVCVVPSVGENKSSAGREVARRWHDVRSYGGGPEGQENGQNASH